MDLRTYDAIEERILNRKIRKLFYLLFFIAFFYFSSSHADNGIEWIDDPDEAYGFEEWILIGYEEEKKDAMG